MKRIPRKAALAALIAGAFAAPSFAQGLEFNGYLRTGFGTTSEGGSQQCFSGQFPIRAKYRLGNECDTYGEIQFGAPFGNKDGAYGKYVLMLALLGGDESDFSSVRGTNDTFNIANRQNYFLFGGIFPKGALQDAKLWIGKRYYNRHDIHINDYFYWNNSGQGAGIEDISVGPMKLAVAAHQGGGGARPANAIATRRLSVRGYGLSVNPGGTLEAEAVYLKGSSADSAVGTSSGSMLMVEHTQSGLLGGFNKLAVIWGNKLGSGFEWLPTYAFGDAGANNNGNSWRIHDQFYFDLTGTNISGMVTASYAKSDCCGGDQTWASVGVRPQYNFTDNYSIAVEAGYDEGRSGNTPKKKIAKLTVAPQATLTKGFWARPVLRGFVTYAKWNDANGDAGTNGVFGTKRDGISYGVQVEAWW